MKNHQADVVREFDRRAPSGFPILGLFLLVLGFCVWGFIGAVQGLDAHGPSAGRLAGLFGVLLLFVADVIAVCGLFTVNPNEGRVLQLFGKYTAP